MSPALAGIPIDFILFGITLLGVALFHRHTLYVALAGLAVITLYKLGFTGFKTGSGIPGLLGHVQHEWVILTNLLCLLLGFALLSRHFEKTRIPAMLPRFLPHDWKGCFALLVIVFVLSSFLDNIAAALIGGAMAHTPFRAGIPMHPTRRAQRRPTRPRRPPRLQPSSRPFGLTAIACPPHGRLRPRLVSQCGRLPFRLAFETA